jgi:hypothetical protein
VQIRKKKEKGTKNTDMGVMGDVTTKGSWVYTGIRHPKKVGNRKRKEQYPLCGVGQRRESLAGI